MVEWFRVVLQYRSCCEPQPCYPAELIGSQPFLFCFRYLTRKFVSALVDRRCKAATLIQKTWRTWLARKTYLWVLEAKRRQEAAKCFQKHWRKILAQRTLARLKENRQVSAAIIQAAWRR